MEVIELGGMANRVADPGLVIAWLEPNGPDHEFDARRARPLAGSVYGVARSNVSEPVRIVLDQRIEEEDGKG